MKDILPAPKSYTLTEPKVYFHAMLAPSIVERLKATAMSRGYKPSNFLEEMLDAALPKKIRRKVVRKVPARITILRTKEVC